MTTLPDIIEILDEGTQGPAGIAWREDPWAVGATYELRDGLYLDGTSYRAIAQHIAATGNKPGAGQDWPDFWATVANKGAKGDVGDKGDKGDKGDIGDVTPQAEAARDAAVGAATVAEAQADTATANAVIAISKAAAAATSEASAAISAAQAAGLANTLGDEFGVDIGKTGGTALSLPAGYLLAASARGAGTLRRLFGRVLDGTGSITFNIVKNGAVVIFDQMVAAGADLSATISLTYAKGDELRVEITEISGTVKWVWFQMDGVL